jgi:hypothetical protein
MELNLSRFPDDIIYIFGFDEEDSVVMEPDVVSKIDAILHRG